MWTSFTERLSQFKQNERVEVILLIADNPELTRISVAWPNISIHRSQSCSKLEGETELQIWKWLWDNTQFSDAELAEASSIRENLIRRKMAPLITNRILYPDGTINSFVQRYLREKVLKTLRLKTKKNSAENEILIGAILKPSTPGESRVAPTRSA